MKEGREEGGHGQSMIFACAAMSLELVTLLNVLLKEQCMQTLSL